MFTTWLHQAALSWYVRSSDRDGVGNTIMSAVRDPLAILYGLFFQAIWKCC